MGEDGGREVGEGGEEKWVRRRGGGKEVSGVERGRKRWVRVEGEEERWVRRKRGEWGGEGE